ncbi:medium-chain acyl-CoA ligase [Thermoplasma volcanium GSS1]|uniref:Medium-chain acyl-CoA ligase n=1 Tax=Thermoplasma volcanium (strain ATCC 51530 / DSM 4299 / JCM 9571 / NBRC 15438 / GSS1) TaxID=273116 RepID=Q978T3_THEVO|nr:fatty acid--CoA ligase [Thermoplasma volcanium]BAB60474.1 medium-chain acyl-CoA ligase [Thermoplasma volcanium GSS1]
MNGDYQLTIDKMLESGVSSNPNQIINYSGKKTFTYKEFRERVYRLAKALISIGVKKGDTVAVIDWDTYVYLEAYFAVPMIGAVLHTVNVRYPQDLIYYTMDHAEDKYVIVRDEFVPILSKNKEAFYFIKGWIIYSEYGNVPDELSPKYIYDELMSKNYDIELPEISENDLATTFYTSGTTGIPKGVQFTHRQIVLHAISSGLALSDRPISLTADDVIMPLVPMFHVHAWGVPYMTIMSGRQYVLPGRYDFDHIIDLIAQENITVIAMVPSILYMIVTNPNVGKIAGRKIRAIIGGGALPEGLQKAAEKLGIMAISGYGLSETAPILTLATYNSDVKKLPLEEQKKYHLKTGIPIPLVQLRVIDDKWNDVPRDEKTIGEIVVRAPWLTSVYVKNKEGTEALWKGGWMHTGDLAVMDKFGYIKIVDREKDAVKSGGEFIPSLILEDAISACPGVVENAVVGKPHEKWGERPVAFYTGTAKPEEIRKCLEDIVRQGRIAKFWIPDDFINVKEFVKTSTGKIDKKVLREMLKK